MCELSHEVRPDHIRLGCIDEIDELRICNVLHDPPAMSDANLHKALKRHCIRLRTASPKAETLFILHLRRANRAASVSRLPMAGHDAGCDLVRYYLPILTHSARRFLRLPPSSISSTDRSQRCPRSTARRSNTSILTQIVRFALRTTSHRAHAEYHAMSMNSSFFQFCNPSSTKEHP
jgi:hypothetical protein